MTFFGQVNSGLLDSKGQVFPTRSDPVNVSLLVEPGVVALVEDSAVSSGIKASDTLQISNKS